MYLHALHLLFAAAVIALVAMTRNYRKKAGELEQKNYDLARKEGQKEEFIEIFGYLTNISSMETEELEKQGPYLLRRVTGQQCLVRVENGTQTVFEATWSKKVCENDLPYEVRLGEAVAKFERPFGSSALASVSAILVAIEKRVNDLQLGWRDPLTNLYNRRKFEQALEYEMDRAERYRGRVSLVLIDIDHFKRYNDEYGHAAGDKILKEIAKIFSRHHRREDTAARIGGEEFGVVLPEIDVDGAHAFAEQIRQEVERHPFEVGGREGPVYVTISVGVCCFPDCEVLADWFFRRTDQALYRSKESGRNRTTITKKIN